MSQRFEYIIDLIAKDAKMKQSLQGIAGKFGSIVKLAGGVGAALAAGKAVQYMKEFAQAADVQVKAEAQLLTALKGNEAAASRLIRKAQELQKVTLFGDEETIKAQSLIAAFVKEEEQIEKIIPLVQDLAAAKGMNLAAAADLVSKTLGSSTNAMSRYGIEVEGAVGSSERLESLMHALDGAFGGQARTLAREGLGSYQQWLNVQGDLREEIGKKFIPVLNAYGTTMMQLTGQGQSLADIWKDQQAKVARLEQNLVPMIDRYEELKSKTQLSVPEQEELSSVIETIAKIVPDAATEFNAYGKAIDVSTEAARKFHEQEKLATQARKKEAIESELASLKQAMHLKKVNEESYKSYLINKELGDTRIYGKNAAENYTKAIADQGQVAQQYTASLLGYGLSIEQIAEKTGVEIETLKELAGISDDITKKTEKKTVATEKAARTLATINDEIKLQEEALKTADIADKAHILTIQQKIEALNAERDAILGLNEAYKKSLEVRETTPGKLTGIGSPTLQSTLPGKVEGLQLAPMNDAIDQGISKMAEFQEAGVNATQLVTDGFNLLGDSVSGNMSSIGQRMLSFVKTMAVTVTKLIAMAQAHATAKAVEGATQSGSATGPLAVFTTPGFIATAIAGVVGAFASLPKFAAGGIVSGPTLGLMGEYPGASSNPEVIAPLDKLKGMLGNRGGSMIGFRVLNLDLQGSKMRYAIQAYEEELNGFK